MLAGGIATGQLPDQERLELVADERAPAGQDRGPEGRGRLARGCHEAAIGAGHGEAHERPAARPRVVEDGAHDELGLGRQPGIQVAAARVRSRRATGRPGPRAAAPPDPCRPCRRPPGAGIRRSGRRYPRRPAAGPSKNPGVTAGAGWLAEPATAPKSSVSCRPLPSPGALGAGRLADAAGHRGGQHGLLVAGVDGRARQAVDERAELVLAEEADDLRAVIVTEAGTVEVQRDGRQAVDGHQLPPEQHVLAVLLELVAQLVRPDLVEARVETLQGGEVHEQLGGRLVTHAGDAGDVVRGVALERLEVDHLGRRRGRSARGCGPGRR